MTFLYTKLICESLLIRFLSQMFEIRVTCSDKRVFAYITHRLRLSTGPLDPSQTRHNHIT